MESAWCPVYVTHVPLASTTDPFLCQSTTVMTSTATPNAQLQLALEALRTFNANVIHELERERLRIRNQDGPKSPAAASCPTMTSITIPPNNGSEADATSVVSSRISSLNVAKNVESSPCSPTSPSSSSSAAFTACQVCHHVLALLSMLIVALSDSARTGLIAPRRVRAQRWSRRVRCMVGAC